MTDAQWRDIRDILRRIGVIADSVMASPERWTPRLPLRATLEWEQRWYANWELRKLPTPTQVQANIKEELAAIAAFRRRYVAGGTHRRRAAEQ